MLAIPLLRTIWECGISDAPEELTPGRCIEVTFQLMYWPELQYEGVTSGSTFTLREGGNIVGFGSIQSEIESTKI